MIDKKIVAIKKLQKYFLLCYNALMQIITGKYKGRKLVSTTEETTKPTLARVKESLFCVIANEIENKVVLDLFAGSGALGIECISRGAKKVYFCDNNKNAISFLKKNLKNIAEGFDICENDYTAAILGLKEPVDLVFLDPPFASDFGEKAIYLLAAHNKLNDGALIVFEHSSEKCLPSALKNCIIEKQKKYGSVSVSFIRYKK